MVGPAITPLSALFYRAHRLVVSAYERVDGHNRLGRDIEIDPAFDATSQLRASSPSTIAVRGMPRWTQSNAKQQVAGPRGTQPDDSAANGSGSVQFRCATYCSIVTYTTNILGGKGDVAQRH